MLLFIQNFAIDRFCSTLTRKFYKKVIIFWLIFSSFYSIPSLATPPNFCEIKLSENTHITRESLEKELAILESEVEDPEMGLFGPKSLIWMMYREKVRPLATVRLSFLQLANSQIASIILKYSEFREEPTLRIQNTSKILARLILGNFDSQKRVSRALFNIHEHVKKKIADQGGSIDEAQFLNDLKGSYWIHATYWDSLIIVYETYVRKLTIQEKEQYLKEINLFARLLGMPQKYLPTNWLEFQTYMEKENSVLEVSPEAKELFNMFRNDKQVINKIAKVNLGESESLVNSILALVASTLPAKVVSGFGLPDQYSHVLHKLTADAAKRVYKYIPEDLRISKRYRDGTQRLKLSEAKQCPFKGIFN
jgi:uncharacterized protein (DUF2236 family)